MRHRVFLFVVIVVAAATSPAWADRERPIALVEARVAGGVATGGGSGISVFRRAPMSATITGDYATQVEPWTSVYGGMWLELDARAGLGAVGGARIRPGDGKWRLSAGGAALLIPYTLYGGTASIGRCGYPVGGRSFVCVDAEVGAFFAGDDLPAGRMAGHVLLGLGVGFDAW